MSTSAKRIEIEIIGDAKNFQNALGKAAGSSDKFGSSLAKLGKLAAVGLAAVGAGAVFAGTKMLKLAGDAQEVDSKMNVVFGKELPKLKQHLDEFSAATGASSFKLREQAADMGALLGPLVGTKKGASEMSEQFVKLATDLGSFNNVPVDEALLAIRSGLVGEAEPLRRFGVLINEAAVNAEALSMGLVKGNEKLTEQQKVMARASLIMQQTTQAQGDAIRTAGSYTNQMKALKNTVTDLATGLGTHLLPAATAVAGGLNTFIKKIAEADGAGAKFGVAMDAIKTLATNAAEGLVKAFNKIDWSKTWDKLIASASTMATQLRDALDQKLGAVDWGNVGAKISDGIVKAIQTVGAVGKKMGDAITAAMHQINWVDIGKVAGPGLAAALVTAFATLMDASFWIKNWDLALAVALAMFGKGLGKLVAPMGKLFKSLGDDAIQALVGGIETNSPKLAAALLAVLTKLPAIVAKGLALLFAPVKAAFTHLGGLAQFTVKVLGLTAAINAVVQFASAVIGKLGELVTGAILGGYEIGKGIVMGILNGLGSLASAVADKARSIAQGAVNAAKSALGIDSPSKIFEGIGGDTIRGFILGIAAQQPALEGKTKEAVSKALDAAKETVGRYQVVLGDAFGKLGEYVGRQFVAKTEAELEKIALKFDRQIARITARADAATPAERELAGIAKSEDERNRERAKAEAEAALVAAQAMEDGVEKERAVAAAKEQIRKADLDNRVAGLEAQAVVERAAAEKQAAEQIAKLEAAKARELQNYEERRAQMEASLDKQLAALAARLSKHPEEYDKIQKKIEALLKSYGIPMNKAGENLGKAFAAGLRASEKEVVAAARALAKAVERNLKLGSPAKEGPLSHLDSWFKPMGPMLAKQMNGSALAAAASRMAGGMVAGPSMAMSGVGAGGGGGTVNHFHFPHYVGNERTLVDAVRTEVQRTIARNK